MLIAVYEQDPLVRSDISETLAGEFPQSQVVEIGAMDEFVKTLAGPAAPVVAVISIDESFRDFSSISKGRDVPATGFVFIADDDTDVTGLSLRHTFVSRPFSSSGLISAIRTALSAQPSSH